MATLARLAMGIVTACSVVGSVAAQDRVALVIGNNAYTTTPRLSNAVNDASAIGKELTRLGFKVTQLSDASGREMRSATASFLKSSRNAVTVFYYAGHGVQIEGKNYLIPVDASA